MARVAQIVGRDYIDIERDYYNDPKYSVSIYRDYAVGKHKVTLTNKQKMVLRDLLSNEFCDNVCEQIISEAKGRLRFLKWECSDEGATTVNDFVIGLYKQLNVMRVQDDIHSKTLRDGNGVLAVGWDNISLYPTVVVEPWWDGTNGVFISYDENGNMAYGVKQWEEETPESATSIKRRNIWYPDRLERWIFTNTEWIPYELPGDGGWPIPWLKLDGTPLHIPYIHFMNRSLDEGYYGKSELAGGIVGFQDQINDLQYAISSAGRLTAYQMYWASGIKPPLDPKTGQEVSPEVGPGNFFTSPLPDSRWGTFPPGDLTQLINAHSYKLKRMAQITATPIHLITGGDWPSGDALLRAELPAVNKAWGQISRFLPAFAEVAHRLTEIWNRFSEESRIDEEPFIEAVYADPEKRDAVSRSVIVHNLAGCISIQEALRIMEYSDDKAKAVFDEMVAEKKALPQPPAPSAIQTPEPGSNPEHTPQDMKIKPVQK